METITSEYELKYLDQLAGCQIQIRKKQPYKWKVFIPNWGIPFEPQVTGEGETFIAALLSLATKLSNVPNSKSVLDVIDED